MAWLVDVVRGLVVVVFFVNVAHLLLPESGLRGYARLVMGLVIVIALLAPGLQVLRLDAGLQAVIWDSLGGLVPAPESPAAAVGEASRSPVAAGQALAAAAQRRVLAQVAQRIPEQVASVATLAAGVEPAYVHVDWDSGGAPRAVQLTFRDLGRASPDTIRVRRVVAQFFGLPEERVDIRVSRW